MIIDVKKMSILYYILTNLKRNKIPWVWQVELS